MQSSSFFCEIKIWRGNFCRNRHIWTLGGTFDFFSFFFTSLVFVQIVNNRIFLRISPPFGNWTVNMAVSNWQSLPKLFLSIGWAQQREVFAFAICSLSEYQLVFFFKLCIVLLDKRLNSKLKRIRWASGLIGSKREQLPWTWQWFCPYINFYKNIFPLQWSWVKVVIQVSWYLFSKFSHLDS